MELTAPSMSLFEVRADSKGLPSVCFLPRALLETCRYACSDTVMPEASTSKGPWTPSSSLQLCP